jgi:class 3 adenylate cyclase/tetratricopeptide (TPR) repeat protein
MQCPRCQQENLPGSKFCLECGAKLDARCPACGSGNPPGHKFCHECGMTLGAGASQVMPSPDNYTPKHLAEKILTSKAALEGERKQVTVLFADLKGSMELLTDRDPEEARRLLDPVLERMMEAVHRYEGTVNQVMGDGIMALFGAPLAHEDHAVRACYAALRIQELVKQYAEQIHRAEGVPIQIRVGLNSGEVVVRSIGSDLRMDYTAVGQTTHVAARLEQMAMPGSVLISSETLALVEGYVVVKSLGPRPIRGLAMAPEVYELVGAATVRSRFQVVAARGGLTRFVGRDAELDQLRDALDEARAGHGQIVAIVGEPGVGKSRLCWEFAHSHRAQGWRVIESGSVSYGKVTNYLPVIELLRAYFEIEASDEPRGIREKVTVKLLSLDRHLEPALPAFLWLLDVPVEDPAWERLEPPQRRQQIFDGVRRLLLRESRAQPLMIVFEDLHWIDAETEALLDSLVESLPTARMLLLVNYRPAYQHTWNGKASYRQLRIDPLPAPSANELLEALLGTDADLRPLQRLLIERTEGNPFFLEESVRTLVETRALVGERGAYRQARAPRDIQVPATVQAILAARIDRLPPEEKSLLQTASVIGKDVPFWLLEAVGDRDQVELHGQLAHLQTAEFVYEANLFPDLEYTFKHALTHEVAYGSLLGNPRRALHARIVGALEQLRSDRLIEHVEQLAHHCLRGELWAKAVVYLRQAGHRALARSAYAESAQRFEEALQALRALPDGRDTLEVGVDLRFELRTVRTPLGQHERILSELGEAEELAERLGDQARLGRVSAYLADALRLRGHHERALACGQRALEIAQTRPDLPFEVAVNNYLGQIYYDLGQYARASHFFLANVERLVGELGQARLGLPFLSSVHSRTWLVLCLSELGDFDAALERAGEAVELAKFADHPFSLTSAYAGLGRVHLRRGYLREALPALERALELSQQWSIGLWAPILGSMLGYGYALSGRLGEGIPLLEGAVHQQKRIKQMAGHALRLALLSEAYFLAGQRGEACALASRALALAREQKERGNEAYALRLLGEIASRLDPPDADAAVDRFQAAMNLGQDLGMRPLIAHCHLGLGRLYRRTGQREQAREHLTTATTMYREMDMRFWLEQAEAAMREVL